MYYFTGTKQLKYKARADDFYEKNLHSKVLILAALVDPRQHLLIPGKWNILELFSDWRI